MKICDKKFSKERSLYNIKDSELVRVDFEGDEDGESPLKECENISLKDCNISLRYALWHTENTVVDTSCFTSSCRAPFWYGKNVDVISVHSSSPKIFRECKDLFIENCIINSEEPFWKINKITGKSSEISGFYAFLMSKNIYLDDIKFEGKYSFQYCKNLKIKNSTLTTKDAFWHAENVYVRNTTIKGEYIGWYSKNLTFVNCTIQSHQPFCHSKNIRLINCTMPKSDLAFEDSSVRGNILGKIDSIKNPKKAKLVVDKVGELIEDKKRKCVHIEILK